MLRSESSLCCLIIENNFKFYDNETYTTKEEFITSIFKWYESLVTGFSKKHHIFGLPKFRSPS